MKNKSEKRLFKDSFGYEWDLNDPETYKNYPKNLDDILEKFYRTVGYAFVYANIHGIEHYQHQLDRINAQLAKLTENKRPSGALIFWQEQLFLLECETENMG